MVTLGVDVINRILVYETNAGQRPLEVTEGVLQGSIHGPMYKRVLISKLPKGGVIVGFVDDNRRDVLTVTC